MLERCGLVLLSPTRISRTNSTGAVYESNGLPRGPSAMRLLRRRAFALVLVTLLLVSGCFSSLQRAVGLTCQAQGLCGFLKHKVGPGESGNIVLGGSILFFSWCGMVAMLVLGTDDDATWLKSR